MEDVIRALTFVISAGAIFLAIMAAEAIYSYYKTGRSGYCLKETLANMCTGFLYKLTDGIAIALVITALAQYLQPFSLQWKSESKAIEFVCIFLLADLFFYFKHYVAHKVRWFWAVHVTHHSSERFNFSTALRQNFLHAIQGSWAFQWIPLVLLGFDPDLILRAIEINLFYQFFIHTQTIGRLGWLESVLNTPSHHRVHHGRNPAQVDRNFGGVFIIWDKVFGTFRDERDAGEIKYGVTRTANSINNPIDIQTHEFIDMFKDAWRHKDIRILYKAPDWVDQHYRNSASTTEIRQQP